MDDYKKYWETLRKALQERVKAIRGIDAKNQLADEMRIKADETDWILIVMDEIERRG